MFHMLASGSREVLAKPASFTLFVNSQHMVRHLGSPHDRTCRPHVYPKIHKCCASSSRTDFSGPVRSQPSGFFHLLLITWTGLCSCTTSNISE